MSIIEKAVDKLRNNSPSVRKKEQQFNAQEFKEDKQGAACQTTQGLLVEKSEVSLTPEALNQQTECIAEPVTKAPKQPSLEIMALNLEGILSTDAERSRHAEEMRMIKRPILQSAFGKKCKPSEYSNLLMLTSAIAGEGKTFTSLNLALSIAAEMDRTVLIVDADLAKPGMSRLLKVTDKAGLTNYLRDEEKDIGQLLLRTDIPKLTVLPAGPRYAHSTELLASNRMKQLFHELAVRYSDRIVLFDSPPLLVTSEASVLASLIGQIILVVESGKTPQHLVKEALAQLGSTDNVSLILNKCKKGFLSTQMGSYGYGYGYGNESDQQ